MSLILSELDYAAPATLEEAIGLLSAHPGAQLLAGGHDLVPAMKAGTKSPGMVVDLRRLGGLRAMHHDEKAGTLTVGAMVTLDRLLADPATGLLAALRQAAESVGDAQVRNASTIGGSLVSRNPAADLAAAALALDAAIVAVGPAGERRIPADDFLTAASSPLAVDEIVTAVVFPVVAGSGSAYVKQPIPATCYPISAVAAWVEIKSGKVAQARVAVTGVFARPRREAGVESAVNGVVPSRAALAKAAKAAGATGSNGAVRETAITDFAGSGEYRLHLAAVQAERALVEALGNAGLHLE
ncbi:MAG TPA: FAD binding domain-containing protein [Actinomycetota bacterium]|nr:FAD binding domain-containing protein [Actinomycetota bacterium]